MLQRNEADKGEEILGERIRQGNDECGGESGGENESSGGVHQHNTPLRLPNRRPHLRLHRNRGAVADGGAESRPAAPCRLHPLVPPRRPGYLESNTFCTFVEILLVTNTNTNQSLFQSLIRNLEYDLIV